ncbi:MAG: DUF5666 domain-containing protein [Thermoanaerobaculia bacterium]
MTRSTAFALTVVLATSILAADASEPGRRRPVTNQQTTVDGVVTAVSPEAFRVQTPRGMVTVALTSSTEIVRSSDSAAIAAPAPGDYTLTDALLAKDGTVTARRVALFTVPASVAVGETIRIEGKVASVSPETSALELETPGGAVITVSVNETTRIHRGDMLIRLSEVEVGSIARVTGKPTGERTLLALEIGIRAPQPQPPPHRDGVAGEVVEVRAAERELVVRRALNGPRPAADDLAIVRTDERTEIYRHRERIRFEDINAGDFVLAQGEFDARRTLLAARIDVADLPEPPPIFAGRVLEVSATTRQFTVAVERGWMHDSPDGPVTVVVGDGTKIYREREQVRFDAIKPGEFVRVAGRLRDDHAVVASIIHIASPPAMPSMPAILGEIVDIEPATRSLVVRVRAMRPMENSNDGTVNVLVDDDTKISRNGQPSRFADLHTGEIVIVVGEVRDDGTLLAERIQAIGPPPRPAFAMGVVASVSERSIDVVVPQPFPTLIPVRVTILTSETTQVFRNGMSSPLSAIKLGDMAFATGEWRDDRTFLASRIEAKAVPVPPGPVVNLRGKIESVSPGGIRVSASDGQVWSVNVSRVTIITRGGVPARLEGLVVGETVEVAGVSTGDRSVTALSIAVVAD